MKTLPSTDNKVLQVISTGNVIAKWLGKELCVFVYPDIAVDPDVMIELGEWIKTSRPIPRYKITTIFDTKPSFVGWAYQIGKADELIDTEEVWE
jgi:hypothetical protein